jgi:TRAP-type C4-dicarboxylate transport system permease small subunit
MMTETTLPNGSILAKTTAAISRFCVAFSALGLVVMTGIIAWQVFGRFVLGESPAWSEQAALVLMVWYITIAAAVGVREGFHIRMTAITDALPQNVQSVLTVTAHLVVLMFGVMLAIYGAELVNRTWAHGIPSLPVPRGFAYLPLPIAGAMIALFSVEHIIAVLTGKKVVPLWN